MVFATLMRLSGSAPLAIPSQSFQGTKSLARLPQCLHQRHDGRKVIELEGKLLPQGPQKCEH